MTSNDLKFDEKVVDVGKATEYLKQNVEFHSTEKNREHGNITVDYDTYKNKIFLTSDPIHLPLSNLNVDKNLKLKLMDLVEKIIENIGLFCQLEYLIRKIPIEETRNIELKLLTQNLIYQSSLEDAARTDISEIHMDATTPLSILGCIALSDSNITIVSCKKTAVVCSLFVNLCRDAGLEEFVSLLLVNTPKVQNESTISLTSTDASTRSVGIVTEKADFDSAVDSFLYATNRYPWRITKIYVQECVLSDFKRSLEWKTKEPPKTEPHLIKPYTSSHTYEDKVYLFEFVGDEDTLNDKTVVIEAYRTNKELISLLSKKRPFCLSLWSSDVSASNELAFAIDSNIVWINDFGCFDGPPIASQSFYSRIQKNKEDKRDAHEKFDKDNILKMKKRWLQLDVSTRYVTVSKVCQEYLTNDSKDDGSFKLYYSSNNSTVDVGKKVCVSIQKPVEILYAYIETVEDVLKFMKYIIDGGSVLFIVNKFSALYKIAEFCKLLSDSDVPVDCTKRGLEFTHTSYLNSLRYNTKVVWSSIGTIFAN